MDDIKAALADMCGANVAVAVQATHENLTPLYPVEQAAIPRAIKKRRLEFTAGRMAARAALVDLGCAPVAIEMAPDRAPIWPEGFTGSISHSNGFAVAIVAPYPARGLGVDIERATPLAANLWPTILLDGERNWLETQPETTRGLTAKHLFSIKECVYKAQYSSSGTLLNFSAFAVDLAPDGHFTATFQIPCPPFAKGDILRGQSRNIAGMIVSTAAL